MQNSKVSSSAVIKFVAINLIVANHASVYGPDLHGGMNLLVSISGYIFCLSFLSRNSNQALNNFTRLASKMLLISIALCTLNILLKLYLNYTVSRNWIFEILHVSNFIKSKRSVSYPIWFVQSLGQAALILWLLNKTGILSRTLTPTTFILLTRISSILIVVILPGIIDYFFELSHLKGKTPDYYLAYFSIGIAICFAQASIPIWEKGLYYVVALICLVYLFILDNADGYGLTRLFTTLPCLIMLCITTNLPFPIQITRVINIFNANLIFIFFLHNYFITFFRKVTSIALGLEAADNWLLLYCIVILSTLSASIILRGFINLFLSIIHRIRLVRH